MTMIVIACAAALVAIAVTVFLVARGSRRATDAKLREVAVDLDERMQAMIRDLSGALDRAHAETRRTRALGDIGSSIDLDVVLAQTLGAAAALEGVDAAVISIDVEGAEPLVVAVGLGGIPPPATTSGPPDGSSPRMIVVEYDYGPSEEAVEGGRIRAAIAVPLVSGEEPVGYLTAYSRSGKAAFGESRDAELEALALRAGPAIDNARRFREARQLADLDALTGLHNRRYFYETLKREVARANRYSRNLALVVFDLDDFKAINDRIGHLAGDAVLAEAAQRVRDVVRSADVACRVGGDEFGVILPESSVTDADQLYKRLSQAVSARPVGQAGRLHLSAGVTELRPDDDAVALFERADEALYRAKGSGKGTVVAVETAPTFPRERPGAAAGS
jgi:diguanylate cyclase (GGDEF)-like protein